MAGGGHGMVAVIGLVTLVTDSVQMKVCHDLVSFKERLISSNLVTLQRY